MADGLKVWNPNGVLVADITSRLPRIIGEISAGAAGGSINDARLSGGTPFPIVLAPTETGTRALINVSISGTTVSWSFPNGGASNYTILYGYY